MLPTADYVSGREALALLGVKRQTLYAYVSRGWIRSLPQAGARLRLYSREDIERARARAQARAGHGAVAAGAMHAGQPIIPTRITEITPAGHRYRGMLATELARSGLPFENVAELLWSGRWHEQPVSWRLEARPAQLALLARAFKVEPGRPLLDVLALFLLTVGASRGPVARRVRDSTTILAARQAIQSLAGCFGYLGRRPAYVPIRAGESLAEGVLRAAGVEAGAEQVSALNAAMILLADHELSPATFSVRVAASSECDLQNCLASAICTYTGGRIGGLYERSEDLLEGTADPDELVRRVSDLMRQGLTVPGFAHPLYPQGDPRARYMINLARGMRGARRQQHVFDFLERVRRMELLPRQELGTVILSRAIGFPRRSASAISTLARVAGWVAHVLEQRLDTHLLRPRAKFVPT